MIDWDNTSRSLADTYRGSRGYVDGLLADPHDPAKLGEELDNLCRALRELSEKNEFWDGVRDWLAKPEGPELESEAWLDQEFKLVAERMGEETARRLFEDLEVLLVRTPQNLETDDVREATRGVGDLICATLGGVRSAARAHAVRWRDRLRVRRFLLGGVYAVAGAALVGVDIAAAIGNPGLVGVATVSVPAGAAAISKAYVDLRRDLEM